ncbi:MAG: DUF1292 domain-containing protein [Clostridiaceae bacterium]
MEEQGNIVELIDESGKTVSFDLVMTFDYEGKRYAALLPVDQVEGVEDDEVVLLEVVKDKSGENYVSIENPILLDEVFQEFLDLFDELIDEDDEAECDENKEE